MDGRVQIDRFAVKNFRSIVECDVQLDPLTFFTGANASGKTSFVAAILFVASALRTSLARAVADRGGIQSILHHPIALPASSVFDFYVSSSAGVRAKFCLELKIVDGWSVSITREECVIDDPKNGHHFYSSDGKSVLGSSAVFPAVSIDRIFLSNASGLPEFRPLFEFMVSLGSAEPTWPSVYLMLQKVNGWLRRLDPTAEDTTLAARFRKLQTSQPDRFEIIQQYLRAIAPPFDHIEVVESAEMLWLSFVETSPSGVSMPFYVSQASAGVVNAAEILLGLFERPAEGKPASVVIIEEPEAFLHPGAIQVLRDSFIEASKSRQVLVTTHSSDLLDDPAVPAESIRCVYRDETGTHIDVLDDGTKSVLRDQLYTAGQLLRHGGLTLAS